MPVWRVARAGSEQYALIENKVNFFMEITYSLDLSIVYKYRNRNKKYELSNMADYKFLLSKPKNEAGRGIGLSL